MRIQFAGRFIADLETGELFRNGRRRRIQDKPFRLLALPLERQRHLTNYSEIEKCLWPDGRVEARHGIKQAALKLRCALGRESRHLQCLRKRGYRLMVSAVALTLLLAVSALAQSPESHRRRHHHPHPTSGQTMCGETGQSGTDAQNSNWPFATPCVTGTNASGYTPASIQFWVGSPVSASFDLGIYADSSSSPGSLLCHTGVQALTPTAGWNTITLPSSCPTLAANTRYWIGYSTSSNTIAQGTVSGNCPGTSLVTVYTNAALTSTALPNPFGANSKTPACYSMVLVLNTITAPPATATLSANPASLSFGTLGAGTSTNLTSTITNTGTATATISSTTTSGAGFSASTAPTTIAAGGTATLTVTFAPTSAGAVTGSATIASNASNPSLTVTLSGTGQAGTLNPGAGFGSVAVGSTGTQNVTLVNNGTGSVTISSVAFSASVFSSSSPALPLTLQAGDAANLVVNFKPTAAQVYSATATVTSTATNGSQTFLLAGTGTGSTAPPATATLTASPASVSFGTVATGSSANQTVVVSNTGTAAATISSTTTTGTGFTAPALPSTIAPNASSNLVVTFKPTATGAASGQVSIASNASNPSLTVALSGTGGTAPAAHSVSLTWTASTSSGISGHNVYRSTTSGGPYTKQNTALVSATNWTDNSVTAGQIYYYVVTAVSSSGAESGYSNQASATVPTPRQAIKVRRTKGE